MWGVSLYDLMHYYDRLDKLICKSYNQIKYKAAKTVYKKHDRILTTQYIKPVKVCARNRLRG